MSHAIHAERIDYYMEQPVGYIVVCDCGEMFDHCSPDGARAAQQHHADRISSGRPAPDFDPRVDYPERFTDGPI